MELDSLIEALCDPAAYPYSVPAVEVRHTHISVVFLAGPFVYKIKKPVELGFLDFSTLEKRRHFCEEEMRLNSRLAPQVYLGVVPITRHGATLKVEGAGEIVEWAVKMERLPDDATLENRLDRGEVGCDVVEALAAKIASFHAQAEAGPRIAADGALAVVAENARQNFEQSVAHIGAALSRGVFDRLRTLTEEALSRHRAVIDARAKRGVPRDTHGDLRLSHVYLLPHRQPPADVVIIDCVEFNERFRFADPVADMAFLVMGFKFHGRPDLARVFADAYFRASGDEEGRLLVRFYTAYRAAVRGKVESLKRTQHEVPEADRASALAKAQGYWLLALGEMERPDRKPCLVLVGGLPGSGKSSLAADLAQRAGFSVIRSDLVRKELAGTALAQPKPNVFASGLYTPEWNERTYAECLRRAEALLFEGRRVVVDASFREEAQRRAFLEAAARWKVPGVFLLCQVEPSVARRRMAQRVNDASDADWSIYLQAAEAWEAPQPRTQSALRQINASGTRAETLDRALTILVEAGLWVDVVEASP